MLEWKKKERIADKAVGEIMMQKKVFELNDEELELLMYYRHLGKIRKKIFILKMKLIQIREKYRKNRIK